MLRGLLVLIVFVLQTPAYAVSGALLTNYEQLVKALETAHDVKAIIHLDKCLLTDSALQSELAQNLEGSTTRFNFLQYLHYKIRINGQLKDTVATSQHNFVEYDADKFWQIYSRLSMYDDNTAIVHVDYYNSTTHKNQWEIEWNCTISNGRDNNGLFLYNSP